MVIKVIYNYNPNNRLTHHHVVLSMTRRCTFYDPSLYFL